MNGKYAFLLCKQAIATGWDCPRAKILVKLREGGSEQFNIQTIGRIRRMPEKKHYDNEILDNCYLYTYDNKFKTGLVNSISNAFYEYQYQRKNTININKDIIEKEILNGEDKYAVNQEEVVKVIRKRLLEEFDDNNDGRIDKNELEKSGYYYGDRIITSGIEGTVKNAIDIKNIESTFKLSHSINTHEDGALIQDAKRRIAKAGNLELTISKLLKNLFRPSLISKLNPFAAQPLNITLAFGFFFCNNSSK